MPQKCVAQNVLHEKQNNGLIDQNSVPTEAEFMEMAGL